MREKYYPGFNQKDEINGEQDKMISIDINPKRQTELSSINLYWVVQPASTAITIDESSNDLAEELLEALKNSNYKTDRIPSVLPEDFEEIYNWFLS